MHDSVAVLLLYVSLHVLGGNCWCKEFVCHQEENSIASPFLLEPSRMWKSFHDIYVPPKAREAYYEYIGTKEHQQGAKQRDHFIR